MKFCKDCKHYKSYTLSNADVCLSPNLPIDLVTGSPKFTLCKDQRDPMYINSQIKLMVCGQEAKWFEPITEIVEDADLDDLSTIPFGKQPN